MDGEGRSKYNRQKPFTKYEQGIQILFFFRFSPPAAAKEVQSFTSAVVHILYVTFTSLICVNETWQGSGKRRRGPEITRGRRGQRERGNNLTRAKLVEGKGGRVNQRGSEEVEEEEVRKGMRKRNEKKKETTEILIHLTWAIREHIGHFV